MTESDLLRFRTSGDDAAMEAIVRATRPLLLVVARRIGSPQDAEDSVQAAYHALLRRADLPLGANVTAWLVTTTVRIAYRRKAVDRRDAVLAERLARPHETEAPHARAARGEEEEFVRRAVHRLPARYRDAVVLHHLESLPLADVARLLDVPEATAKTRVQRGRALLRWRLAPMLAHAFVCVPWAAADAARAALDPATLVAGGVMKSKLAAGAVLLFALGAGVGIGAVGSSLIADAPPEPALDAAAPPARGGVPRGDAPASSRPRASGTARAPDRDEIRRLVNEEVARALQGAGGGASPSRPPEARVVANPELNADPALRETVRQSVLDIRRDLIQYELGFDVGALRRGLPLSRPDPARLEKFPDDRVWPSSHLGWVQRDPAAYEILAADALGFDGTRGNAGWVFTAPLDHAISTDSSATLIFEKGVTAGGKVSLQSYGTIRCKGNFAGAIYLDSYATVIVDGDFTGSVTATSYATIHVGGRFTGSFDSNSYANLRVMGGFQPAKVTLSAATNLYLGGYTAESVLDSITFEGFAGQAGNPKGRVSVVLERGDSSPGTHQRPPSMEVTVLPPR